MIKRAAVVTACVLVSMLASASSAFAALGDVETPTVTGPIANDATLGQPWQATDIDLSKFGYVEQEFYVAGDAFAYQPNIDPLQTATKITTGGPANDGKWPYVTRITVRRPATPAAFNGTAVVEWNNVTAQFDLEANWFNNPEYLLRNGYAWIGVSAQRVGVNSLKALRPARYGTLDIPNPTTGPGATSTDPDGLSFEIYSAALKALLGAGNGVDPLGGLNPQTVIASGESQSGSRLGRYFNQIQPIHELAEAFLLTVSTTALRSDRTEKVIRILSENENKNTQAEADSASLRHWEVAGASHLPELAYQQFRTPVERDLGTELVAFCEKNPLSHVQWAYVQNAAIANLVSWTNGAAAPPVAPRGTYTAPNTLARNSFGIAEGGIRLPEVTVPVATNTGVNTKQPTSTDLFSNFCPLLGSYEIFPQTTIDGLYPDFGVYIDKVRADATTVAGQGFILADDIERLVGESAKFAQLRPEAPYRSAGKQKNKGTLSLAWRGTAAPATTFAVQHAKPASDKWSNVKGAGALTAPALNFKKGSLEADGKWRYRVRSTTGIPRTPVAAAYTVTTAYSEPSGTTVVDRTKPKLRVTCPKRVLRGARAFARVRASDATSGLRKKPKAKVRIATGKLGKRTTKRTVADRLGNRRTDRCVTRVAARR